MIFNTCLYEISHTVCISQYESWQVCIVHCTAGEKKMYAPKMRNNIGAIKFYIGLFSIAPSKVISFNLLCFIFGISSLLLFLIAISDSTIQ